MYLTKDEKKYLKSLIKEQLSWLKEKLVWAEIRHNYDYVIEYKILKGLIKKL